MTVTEAKEVCKSHGYYVIEREKVEHIQSETTVADKEMHQYRNEGGFMEHLTRRAIMSLNAFLLNKNIVKLDLRRSPDFSSTLRATLAVIPHELAVDPYLEWMRRTEEGQKP